MNWPAAIVLIAAIAGLATCGIQGAPGEQIAIECIRQRGEIVLAWGRSAGCVFKPETKAATR